MFTPETSKHFEKWTDPESGIVSYVLKTKVAAQQQGFYFVNSATDNACRYLWFYCSFPPAMYMTLGVVDFETDEVHHFPETSYICGPLVDPDTGECIFAASNGFWRKSPKADVPMEFICPIPQEITQYGRPGSLATHLTYSPDKKEIFLDAGVNEKWVHGTLELATGKFTVWNTFNFCKNHAQLNPKDGDLNLYAEDFWTDKKGVYHIIRTNKAGIFQRLWLETRDGHKKMIPPLDGQRATHEWWNAAGTRVYYCRYTPEGGNNAIVYYDINTHEHKVAAPVRAWHGFTTLDDRYLTYDENDVFYRGTASQVGFYNTDTKKQVYIVTHNPAMATKEHPSAYHLDPHPRFVAEDRYICYTIAQNGYTEVAMCPTAQLIERTK